MIITRKAIPRRTVLRGLGATSRCRCSTAWCRRSPRWPQTPARPINRFGVMYVAERHDHGELDACGRRRRRTS